MAMILPNLLLTLAGALGVLSGCTAVQDAQAPAQAEQADQDGNGDAPPAPARPDPATVDLLEQIEAASSEIKTLTARVRYTRIQTLTGDQQRRFGDFYYKAGTEEHPTLFAVLFDRLVVDGRARPMQTWFIFDGNWLLERDHKDKSAVRRELVPKGSERSDMLTLGDGQMPIPLRLKADVVLDRFNVARLKDELFGEDQVLAHLRLTPKQARQGSEPLDLWFYKRTLLLHKVVTVEDGDEIEMLFTEIEKNPEIKPALFKTALPDKDKGWQVQEVPLD